MEIKRTSFFTKANCGVGVSTQGESAIQQAVQQAVDELIREEFPSAGVLPLIQRAYLIHWMAKDPIIQSRMLNYLRRTLG